jgi:hypothetical protein
MAKVYLSKYKEQVKSMIDSSEYNNIEQAIEILCNNNLKYNTNNGKTYSSKGVISEYVNKNDITVNISIEDVLKFEFLPFVKNECKRIDYFKNQGKTYYY